eukprot:4684456-Karenia_brevis.AAC.1
MVTFAQCRVGLVNPEGDPVLKHTALWSSHLDILKAFEDVRCEHLDHASLQGQRQGQSCTKLAQ